MSPKKYILAPKSHIQHIPNPYTTTTFCSFLHLDGLAAEYPLPFLASIQLLSFSANPTTAFSKKGRIQKGLSLLPCQQQ